MASALMAWVWIGFCTLTLARLNNAEIHRYAHRRVADRDELSDGNQQLFEAPPEDWTDLSFPAPDLNYVQGNGKSPGTSELNQPQYRCSNGTLILRFSRIRYTNLRLEDGVQLLSLPERCRSSASIDRWWLLVKLPYTGCQNAQTGDGVGFSLLKLHYFDRLLQENMTGIAVCENPVMSAQAASPLVTCSTMQVTVKLPRETKLRKVKALDSFTNEGYSVKQRRTPSTLFVELSKLPDRDSGFELVYVDSSGRLCTMLVTCPPTLPKEVGRHHVRRSLFELGGFSEVPPGPLNLMQTKTSSSVDTTTNMMAEAIDDDAIYELWGFEEIPEIPYAGINVISGFTASTAASHATQTSTMHTTTPSTTATKTTAVPATTLTTTAMTTTTWPAMSPATKTPTSSAMTTTAVPATTPTTTATTTTAVPATTPTTTATTTTAAPATTPTTAATQTTAVPATSQTTTLTSTIVPVSLCNCCIACHNTL